MNDYIGLLGVAMVGVGCFNRFGWDIAVIICGTILLVLAVIGAMRR